MPTITSIGIGNMGAALASALLTSPTPPALTIWNRTADRPQVKSLINQGAVFEPSLAAAIARSTTLLICLLDYPSITAVLQPMQESSGERPLEGKTIINLTNGTPAQAREMEVYFKTTLGAKAYLDGGIMVTPQLVGSPASFVILSGETETVFQSLAAEQLKPIGAVQYVSSDAGAASLYDVAALSAMYGMFMGAFTGIALLKKQKGVKGQGEGKEVKTKPVVDGVVVPLLTAIVPYVSLLADAVDKEAWMDDMGNPLAMQVAGVKNIIQACEEEGVDEKGHGFMLRLMERAVADGFGPGGVPAVAKYMFK